MTDLKKPNGKTKIISEDKIINAHEYLKKFLDKFEGAKRGGIHDFIELTVFNMIQSSIMAIDSYLQKGNKQVNATELMSIVADSYQKVIDGVKRNLESIKEVHFK